MMTKEEIKAERERLQIKIERARELLNSRESALNKFESKLVCRHPGVTWRRFPGEPAYLYCPYCGLNQSR